VPNTQYNDLSSAVHDLVTSINIKHQHLSMCVEYQFLTKPEDEGGMGRVGSREYIANLKCAVANSVNRIQVGNNGTVQFVSDARVGMALMEDISRLELLDAEERDVIDSEHKLPFWFSRS
jgi:hypothetical protein